MGYGGLLSLQVDNGFCDNYLVFRDVTTSFNYLFGSC